MQLKYTRDNRISQYLHILETIDFTVLTYTRDNRFHTVDSYFIPYIVNGTIKDWHLSLKDFEGKRLLSKVLRLSR